MILNSLGHASLFSILGLLVSAAPLVAGILYVVRPDERRLALMRPLSLAAIFASVSNLLLGVANAFEALGGAEAGGPAGHPGVALLLAEATMPTFLGFACLTVAWLCVAVAIRRAA